MKYRVLKNTVANGERVQAGDIIDIGVSEAAILMGYGRIVPHHEAEITTSVVDDIQHGDPVIKRRGRKPKNGL